ncbi:MAG: hypothetical protein PHS63_08915, partial [Desulfoplanes sp.]|nr:hypothetical protein [Desulfoplanes sp.]
TYYSFLQGSEDFFNYENIDGMYGVSGKKHGYNVAITIMDSNCIFRCGGAAVPVSGEPPFRNYRATIPA